MSIYFLGHLGKLSKVIISDVYVDTKIPTSIHWICP